MYTGGFSPRDAGGRGLKGRENIGSGSLYIERIGLLGLPGHGTWCPRATERHGGPPQDWEVSLNFWRCRPCWIGNTE